MAEVRENFVTLSSGVASQDGTVCEKKFTRPPQKAMTLVDISDLNLCSCLNTTAIGGREEFFKRSVALPDNVSANSRDNQLVRVNDLTSYFRIKITENPNRSTAASRQKAFNAFVSFVGKDEITADQFSESFLLDWAVWMIQNGYTQKTVAFYMKQLGTLYNQAVADGLVPPSEASKNVRDRVSDIPERDFVSIDVNAVDKLQRFLKAWAAGKTTKGLAADVVAFAILNGGLSFQEIAGYKKVDYHGDNQLLKSIVEKYVKPRNKYLFPLDQSSNTPAQMKKELSKLFYLALTPFGLKLSKHEETTAADLWSMAALESGVAPCELAGLSDGYIPSFNPVLKLIDQRAIADDERAVAQKRIIAMLTDNPMNWYAMQFRPRVKYEQIRQALEEIKDEVKCSDLFYPSEEIMRRIGHKMVKERRPVVPGLLFFKSRATDIPTIFRHIGNLAWCYRQTNDHTSPYAIIPSAQIQAYQTIIGQFTPDMELLSEDSLNINENDRVIILGGSFVGHTATVSAVKPTSAGRTIYKLSLIGNNNLTWTVTADSNLVHKTS